MKNLAKIFGINTSETTPPPETPKETIQPDYNNNSKYAENDLNNSKPHAEIENILAAFKMMEIEQSEVKKVHSSIIFPNPFQPRKNFNQEALEDLAASIKEFGIIQPLLVRPRGENYQLIAGERRLRASKIAGLSEVPVIIRYMTDTEMAELAMIENLQREDLHFLEEAEGFSNLIANFSITQEALAKRMGKSQSFIANKLRLLKLSEQIRQEIFEQKLTERHARAILKIEDEKSQLEILETIVQKRLNVKQTEEFIEKYIKNITHNKSNDETSKQRVTKIIKDVRIFINTINSVASQMKKNGMDIDYKQDFDGEYVTITMQIKNNKPK